MVVLALDHSRAGGAAAFLYRDYGFRLASPEVPRLIKLFRNEFGLSANISEEAQVFDMLFLDDAEFFKSSDLELLTTEVRTDG